MIEAVAAVGGRMLRALFRGMLLFRRPRPIHARGLVLLGSVRWLPGARPAGIRWVDVPPPGGTQEVTGRLSRSVGLPPVFPDIVGLALRFDTAEGQADLELASTGFGFPSRFWLAPHRSPSKARLSTLLPYRTENGPVLLAARTIAPSDLPSSLNEVQRALAVRSWRLRLYHATPTGPWHPFATVELAGSPTEQDTALRFDAARNPLPGAAQYRWIRRLRDPSYRLVQN
jgi:hypothetical protein